jgi:hypothetical protein
MLSSLRPSQQGARAASVRSLDQPALFGVLLPCAALREPGWPDDQASVCEAVRRGTAAGALTCPQFGAMKGLPTVESSSGSWPFGASAIGGSAPSRAPGTRPASRAR